LIHAEIEMESELNVGSTFKIFVPNLKWLWVLWCGRPMDFWWFLRRFLIIEIKWVNYLKYIS
jgi:hypothetical protein